LALSGPKRSLSWFVTAVRTRGLLILTALVGFVLGLVPFALIYLPARGNAPGSTYAEVMGYAGRVHDLVDFGRGNVFWSSAVHALVPQVNYGMSELNYAITPFLMLGVLAGGALCLWWLLAGRAVSPATARMAAALAATAVIADVLPLHTRIGTPWAVIYHLPGAREMRAIDRIQIVAGLAAFLALTAAATEVWNHAVANRQMATRLAVAVVVALTIAEQINTTPASAVSPSQEDARLAAARPPPAGCRSFYIVDPVPIAVPVLRQIDAMLISQKLHLPTINGYTAYSPRGWTLEDPASPGYLAAIKSWADQEGVSAGLCRLDLVTMTWQGPAPL
jgi:hypothetical protein